MRLGWWSFVAGLAVAIAVWVGSTETGLKRLAQSLASLQDVTPPRERPSRESVQATAEMQRLADSLKEINIDRNRLIERLEAIEKRLSDITGSLNRVQAPTQPAETAPVTTGTIAAAVAPPAGGTIAATVSNQPQLASQPLAPRQEAAEPELPAIPRVEFGVDLGGAQTIEGLRTLWATIKSRHGTLLDGLRPLITVREKARPGSVELRLVAGPLANAATAARLCAIITAAGAVCQPAVFDGQRLALR
ncbi:MAG TPA: hypothetical protein VNL39_15385 [Xanthobacteraceae bacterium]|nr:hypothetical protein [Xanthobacteraceae bacterium]